MNIKILKHNSKKGFHYLDGINREVTGYHVTKLAKFIEKMGIIRPIVTTKIDFITGIENLYIVDGQHLYEACRRLEIDAPYIEIEVKNREELIKQLALLNTSSKSWRMRDYITAWTSERPDYRKLNRYFNRYDIELVQLASILSYGSCVHEEGGGGSMSKAIKEGKFKIGDEKMGISILSKVTDLLKIVPRMDRSSNKLLISSYVTFLNSLSDYDHENYLKKVKKHKSKFALATQNPLEFKKLLNKINT